jgi:hypothetical protein
MKRKILAFSVIFGALWMSSCTSYVQKEYGPVDFETAFEGGDDMLFEGPNEAIVTIPFKPEDFGIVKENVGGMQLKEIKLVTNNSVGFGAFDNLKIEVASDETSSLTIGVLNEVPDATELVIQGLEEAKIKKFNKVNEFYLIISGNLKEDLDEVFDISGSFVLFVESSDKD